MDASKSEKPGTSSPAPPATPPTAASPPVAAAPPAAAAHTAANAAAPESKGKASTARRSHWKLYLILAVVAALALYFGIPAVIDAFTTVSTDDAYVNGHVTFVAPRVQGQVTKVYVEDNNRVRKGDLLLQLDKAPYVAQVNIAQAAVTAAQTDVDAAEAQARGLIGQARSARYALQHAIENVDNQEALLRAKVATLESQQAALVKAQGDYDRALPLVKTGGISSDEFAARKEALAVAKATLEEALQAVYQVRVSLGLSPKPESGDDLTQVPADLDENFSSVKEAQANLIQAAAQLGVTMSSYNESPKQMIAEFYRRNPTGDIDKIYAEILKKAPTILQAKAKLLQAQRNLDLAQLNLSYTDVYAEIDGVITRREVNPGDNVVVGQSVMAIRSLSDIWVDANFKETQLEKLRIGQPVTLELDMYGGHHEFKGRVSGFTMGTGSTLALLPAENATGNFVKVVQRLPVRIDILDYNPDKLPLFIGTSVTPYVHINEAPTGPDAGKILQPYVVTPATGPSGSQP